VVRRRRLAHTPSHHASRSALVERAAGEIVFSLPSGGFGNGFSGYLTKRMGLPVKYFIPAVNDNDTLHRFFSQGL
jgi:threonine synthase